MHRILWLVVFGICGCGSEDADGPAPRDYSIDGLFPGPCSAVTEAGETITYFEYDLDPELRVLEQRTLDTESTVQHSEVLWTYDAQGRVTEWCTRAWEQGRCETYTLNADGLRVSAEVAQNFVESAHQGRITYDALGRPLQETRWDHGNESSVRAIIDYTYGDGWIRIREVDHDDDQPRFRQERLDDEGRVVERGTGPSAEGPYRTNETRRYEGERLVERCRDERCTAFSHDDAGNVIGSRTLDAEGAVLGSLTYGYACFGDPTVNIATWAHDRGLIAE